MPKLLFFLACERVIVSREGPLSLITVLEGLNLNFPAEEYANLPDDAVAPTTWFVVAKWAQGDNEESHLWEQRIQVVTPNGRISTDATMSFDLATDPGGMRNIIQVNGFPVKPLGAVSIVLSLREAGRDDTAWQEVARYPINVHNPTN